MIYLRLASAIKAEICFLSQGQEVDLCSVRGLMGHGSYLRVPKMSSYEIRRMSKLQGDNFSWHF